VPDIPVLSLGGNSCVTVAVSFACFFALFLCVCSVCRCVCVCVRVCGVCVCTCAAVIYPCTLTCTICIFTCSSLTGSWIHLHHLEQVSSSILAVVGNMLDDIMTGYISKQSSVTHRHETLSLTGHFMCFASLTTHSAIHTTLPEPILKIFHQVSFLTPQLTPILDGLLVSEGFKYSSHLTKHVVAVVEVFERLVLSSQHHAHSKLGLASMKKLVGIASKLFNEVQNLGLPMVKIADSKAQMRSHSQLYMKFKTAAASLEDAEGDKPIGRTLEDIIEVDDSLLSLISSQGSYTMQREPSTFNNIARHRSEMDELHYRTLEEFSLVLGVKECLFPYFDVDGVELKLFLQFISEHFPGCDLYTVLAEEKNLQQSLLTGVPQHTGGRYSRARVMLHTGQHLTSDGKFAYVYGLLGALL